MSMPQVVKSYNTPGKSTFEIGGAIFRVYRFKYLDIIRLAQPTPLYGHLKKIKTCFRYAGSIYDNFFTASIIIYKRGEP
ncbi:hypothetical protein X474_22165 [Dethiosulfatarculus sandiegensis]|uniref:Uncharacterized protein n=1 Tax=Dethiosulfatarculus sandiegensis TaxID=1429043 RepID=A0A0D2J0R2_9BACT|nr:hypothetical protein X474_22165 [Dethiosulfatarculus sandiegensis]